MASNSLPWTLEQIKADQGPFENEVMLHEGDQMDAFAKCSKNPGHAGFIPIHDFNVGHLPSPDYQDQLIVDNVKSLSDLTVCVRTHCISPKRPDTFQFTERPYPFRQFRGNKIGRCGTGWIVRVRDKVTENDGRTCKCTKCFHLPESQRSRTFGKVMIWTAKHLVYDKFEAMNSEVELFYDRETSSATETASSLEDAGVQTSSEAGSREAGTGNKRELLYPYRMWRSDLDGDWCGVYCVTHDLHLWERLRQMYKLCDSLQRQMDAKYKDSNEHLAIIVSHPHGLSKRVSVGRWSARDALVYKNDNIQTYYFYNTCTCSGSSGAPVWILGRNGRGNFTCHPHSCVADDAIMNRSAVGFDW